MKCLKWLSLVVFLIVLGCQKNDRLEPIQLQSESSSKVVNQKQEGIKESDWLTPESWKSVDQPTFSLHFSELKTPAVTDDIVDQGLVRVFKISSADKTSDAISLPFEEIQDGQKIYWYYEVTSGNILIAADVYGKKSIDPGKFLFKYIILNNLMIENLVEKGIHQTDMMDLSYDKMKEISR